jgi:metal-responsive CopG/Arc/MetJ family transcriptional regulator
MSTSKIAITLNSQVLSEVDALVKRRIFPSRSRAIQEAVKEKRSPKKGWERICPNGPNIKGRSSLG